MLSTLNADSSVHVCRLEAAAGGEASHLLSIASQVTSACAPDTVPCRRVWRGHSCPVWRSNHQCALLVVCSAMHQHTLMLAVLQTVRTLQARYEPETAALLGAGRTASSPTRMMQDLRRSNFTSAECRHCNFKDANLAGTYFIKANVFDTNFQVYM